MTIVGPFAVSTLCYGGEPLEAGLEGIAAAGFPHVELGAIPGLCQRVRPT